MTWQQWRLLRLLALPGALFSRLYAMPWYGGMLREWAMTGLAPGMGVLEMGGGRGDLSAWLVTQGVRPVVLEMSRMAVVAGRLSHPQLAFVRGDALQVPAHVGTFDAVLAGSLLNVVPEPVALLDSMRRATRKGGHVHVLVPDAAMDARQLQQLVATVPRHAQEAAALQLWHRMARKMSAPELTRHFRDAGLPAPALRQHLQGMALSATAMHT